MLAGHGIVNKGRQALLLNEFSETTKFYKFWAVESNIRSIATEFKNSYSMTFFACCREIFGAEKHSGCFEGTMAEAEKYFRDQDEKDLEEETAKATELLRLQGIERKYKDMILAMRN